MNGAGDPRVTRDTIWSPWRMQYIRSEKPKECVFCEIATAPAAEDRDRYVVFRGKTHYVVLNVWPYNNGHAMVVPYRHLTDLTELDDEEVLETFDLSRRLVETFRATMNAQGVNVGWNLGQISRGSIAHLPLHLVPRWAGDANFMPVIGQTKVLVELLSETWDRLREASNRWHPTE